MLSLSQKQVILGGLLGDSSLKKQNVQFLQSIKQEEYLLWKSDFFNKDIKYNNRIFNGKSFRGCYFYYYIKNEDIDFYSFIRKHLYSHNKKKISLKYLNELDALALAVWWMDDGCLSIFKGNRYGKLSTECFNYEEHILLKKYFKSKWDIDVSIKLEKGKYYFLRFNVTELKKLISVIYKYVCEIPSMIYKIDLNYKNKTCIGEDFVDIYNYINEHKQ